MSHPVKTLLAGAVVVALSLLLTGCLEVQLKFDLRDTGSGTATWIVEIPKTTADTLGLTTDKLKAELLKDSQFRGRNVQITAGRAPNGNQTLTAVVPFENVQEISAKDLAIEFQKNPDGKQCSFRMQPQAAQMVPLTIKVEVHMPGKIVNSNADSVSGNVAYFDSLYRPGGISVQSETGGFLSGSMIILLIGGVAALAAILVLVMRASRRKAAPGAVAASASLRCARCGRESSAPSKFCQGCGSPLAPPVAAPAPAAGAGSAEAVLSCPKCGAAGAPGKKFCVSCGLPLLPGAVPAAPPAPAPPPPFASYPPSPATPYFSAPPPPFAPSPPAPEAAPRGHGVRIALLVASLLLLVGATGLLIYKISSQKDTPAEVAQKPPAPVATSPAPAEATPPAAVPGAAEPQTAAPPPPPQQAAEPPVSASPPKRPSPAPRTGSPPSWSPPTSPPVESPPQPEAQSPPVRIREASPAPVAAPEAPPPPRQQTNILRPQPSPGPAAEPVRSTPVYSGPRSGVIIWSGQLERNGLVEINGPTASFGSLRGELPGVAVLVDIDPKDIGVAEAPSPQNGWKRLVLRSRNRKHSVVTIRWTVVQ